ncbi:hypothetical protein [Mariniflexile sp.]|uniref:hypothetical protein n=1 Tax=Flavobacteriaceae TaxID=49546 RepID=UPI004047BF58
MTDLDKILAIVAKHYQEWEQNPSRMENGYQYESTFASMTQEMEKEMLEVSLGKVPASRNKKKKPLRDLGPSTSQKATS